LKTTDRRLTVVALVLATFMAAMEMTVVSTAMPTTVAELGGVHLYAWAFTAYMLTSTITVPIYGKLADLYGRKPVMMFGMALFLAASVLCGAAPSMGWLIAGRALQGLGAGAMQPIALTIVGDIFDLRERARMQGVFGAVWGFAGLIGPMVGGLIVKYASWPWVFYINVPFGLGAMALLAVAFHERLEGKKHRLDLAGALLLAAGVLLVLLAARGSSRAALLEGAAAAALLAVFVAVERRAAEPLLPLGLFRRRVMAVSSAASALAGAAMFSLVSYVPLYVQAVLGGSATAAGSVITPMAVGWPISSTLAGRLLPRWGFRRLIRLGLLITALAALGLALFLRPGMNLNTGRALTALFGVGMGFAMTALLIAVQTSVEWQQRGVATASSMFFRTIGGTLAVGILGGVLAAALRANGGAAGEAAVQQMLQASGHGGGGPALPPALASALGAGLHTIFAAIAAIAAAGFVVCLLFPRLHVADPGVRPPAPGAAPASADEPIAGVGVH
jgi:EmrB/QacA subfamily drug resistance transporter